MSSESAGAEVSDDTSIDAFTLTEVGGGDLGFDDPQASELLVLGSRNVPANGQLGDASFVLTLTTAVGDTETTLTLEDVAKIQSVSSVRMSPGGDRIAYLKFVPRSLYEDDDGKAYRELHVVGLNGKSRPYVAGEIDSASVPPSRPQLSRKNGSRASSNR